MRSLPLWLSLVAACSGEIGGDDHRADPDAAILVFVDAGVREPDATAPAPDAGASPDAGFYPNDRCGDVRLRAHVYYGTLAPSYVPLTAGQILAIGRLYLASATCSGTLIGPRWVLTASHCTRGESASSVTFAIGTDPSDPSIRFAASRLVDHPEADMALIELEEDVTETVPEIVPLRIHTGSIAEWAGRTGEASGYGRSHTGTSGTRYFTAEPIVDVGATFVTIDGEGERGVCFGDSGGPLLGIDDLGGARVIGDLSYGDSSCVGEDHYTRVDLARAWIESYVGPTPEDPPPDDRPPPEAGSECDGGIGAMGACDGSFARWCDDGVVRERDCGACGQTCGWVDATLGYYCR